MKLTIGENIKKLRREKNITQEELCVSCADVSKWERSFSPKTPANFAGNFFSINISSWILP